MPVMHITLKTLIQSERWRRPAPAYVGVIVAALLVAPVLLPTLTEGFPPTSDGELHMHRSISAALILCSGMGWPRWAPHFYQGYGYPIHNFYPPGLPIIAGLLINAGVAPVAAQLLVQGLALVLYAVGAYLFVSVFLPAPAALLGAAAFTYAPFRLREVWVQGDLPQLAAMGLLPWVLWAIARAAQKPGAARAVGVGVSFAALVLAHHGTAFLFAPVAGLYALIAPFVMREPDDDAAPVIPRLGASTGGLALGLALSAIYWAPALAQWGLVNLQALTRGSYDIAHNFVSLGELLALSPPLDRSAVNPPMPHNLGAAQVLLALLGAAALRPRAGLSRRARRHILLGLAGALLCVVMMLPVSEWLWRTIPMIRLVQFPWRLVGFAELFMLPAMAAALVVIPARRRDRGLLLGLALVFLTVIVYIYPLRPARQFDDLSPASVTAYEQQRGGARGTVSADEYLPQWVEKLPPLAPVPEDAAAAYTAGRWRVNVDARTLPGDVTVTYDDDASAIILTPGAAFALQLRQFYFPGWQATVDGAPVEVRPSEPEGLLTLDAPASTQPRRVVVRFAGTEVHRAAEWLSAGALAFCAIVAISAAWSRRQNKTRGIAEGLPVKTAAALTVAALAVALVNQGVMVYTDWLRPRSDPAAPPAMQHPLHVRLADAQGEAVELLGYDLSTDQAAQGDAVHVRLYWRALRPLDVDYRPFVHWDSLTGAETWANSTLSMPGDVPTSRWDTGLYALDDHELHIPGDAPPVVGNLRVGLLAPGSDERLHTADGADTVYLAALRVTGEWPGDLPDIGVNAGYRLGESIRLQGWEARQEGDAISVALRWYAGGEITTAYTVFRHVLGADGEVIAYGDGPPVNGIYPTNSWAAGQAIPDEAIIPLPAGAEGPFTLAVGLYDPATGARPAVYDAQGVRRPDDAIVLPVAGP
ncbi:MAG: hypothetical protein JXB47_05595 [Anaerolineae bacterium]|nr:hypothetical protein [Anaerolineae bacterium]